MKKKRKMNTDLVPAQKTDIVKSDIDTNILLGDIRSMIESAKGRVATAVNVEMVILYWGIGERIQRDILGKERAGYGKRIVDS